MGVVEDIKSLKIQGASSITVASLKYLMKFSRKHGFGKEFDKELERLLGARPTTVMLYNAAEILKKNKNIDTIKKLIKRVEDDKKRIVRNGAGIFRKKSVVMTHCHSSEVVALLKASKNKIKKVYVTETRPMNQGLITAKELKKEIPVTFIVDSAIGYYMKDVDVVVVGSDSIRKEEGIINKIGTMPLAIVASEFGKPFFVVASSLKIDKRKVYEIEMRAQTEIGRIGVKILNPAFDITPWKYITGVVTEKGILKPVELQKTFFDSDAEILPH